MTIELLLWCFIHYYPLDDFSFKKLKKHTFFTKTNKPTSNPQTQPQRDWKLKSSLEWIYRTTMGC